MHRLAFHYTLSRDAQTKPLRNALIALLQAVASQGSISAAARALGLSYRHVWGELKRWENELGNELLQWDKGKSARLSSFGEKLMWAERQAQARLMPQISALQADLEKTFAVARISLIILLFMITDATAQSTFVPNYDENKVVNYSLPDVGDIIGERINNVSQWEKAKGKWLQIYASEMYGTFPSKKISVTSKLLVQKPILNGKAEMKVWEVSLAGKVKIHLIGFIPLGTPVKAALLGLNFCGINTVFMDAEIPVSSKYVICNENPFFNNHIDNGSRRSKAAIP